MNSNTVRWTVFEEGRLCKREPPLVALTDKVVSEIISDGIGGGTKFVGLCRGIPMQMGRFAAQNVASLVLLAPLTS